MRLTLAAYVVLGHSELCWGDGGGGGGGGAAAPPFFGRTKNKKENFSEKIREKKGKMAEIVVFSY